MSFFYNAVNSSLRATEVAAVAVDALVLPGTPTGTPRAVDVSDNWHDRRVLAMVSHKDEWALSEEGAYVHYHCKLLHNMKNPV
jgi:phosphatidylinositol-bisphosphatase